MVSMENIHRVSGGKPFRGLIYGPPGVGKSSLASEFPGCIFVQTEDGEGVGVEFDTFGLLTSWPEVMQSLSMLASNQHDYQNIVLDSIDYLEPLIWRHYCEKEGLEHIDDAGYGRGYKDVDSYWHKLFTALNYLRDYHGMGVILLGHSCVVNRPNPTGAEFPSWNIRLHSRAHAIVEDNVSAILMLDYDNATFDQKGKGGAKTTKSTGSTMRWIYCQGSPARNAKNRYGMPSKLLYNKGQGFSALQPFLSHGPIPESVAQPAEAAEQDENQPAE